MRKTVKFSLLFLRHSFYFFHSLKNNITFFVQTRIHANHFSFHHKYFHETQKPRFRKQISLSPKPGYKIILRFKTCVKERRFDTT